MIDAHDENAVNERQAARYLGVSPGALRLWRAEGRAPRFFRAGGLIRFRRVDLDLWIEARSSEPSVTR